MASCRPILDGLHGLVPLPASVYGEVASLLSLAHYAEVDRDFLRCVVQAPDLGPEDRREALEQLVEAEAAVEELELELARAGQAGGSLSHPPPAPQRGPRPRR